MNIFRSEAVRHQGRRLHGSVAHYQPVQLTVFVIGSLIFATGLIAFLCVARIARKETVIGWLSPEAGISEVYALRVGTIDHVSVNPGQRVSSGQVLASASVDVAGQFGDLAGRGRIDAQRRIDELKMQLVQGQARHDADQRQLYNKSIALQQQVLQVERQRGRVRNQIALASNELRTIKPVVDRGFISIADVNRRTQSLLSLQESEDELDRQISVLKQAISDAKQEAGTTPNLAAIEASQVRSAISSVNQSIAELDVQSKNVYKSKINGIVAYSNAKVGQNVSPSIPLFAIAPDSSPIQAVVLIPSRSIGFVKVGQTVRIMVDAYPYQHFGIMKGYVSQISRTSINPNQILAPVEVKESVFRVVIRSYKNSGGFIFAKSLPLRSGMTLHVDIIVDRRSLIDWIFDPIIAAKLRSQS
ncbi:HlyD family efflux transporter periplasmic adaptor subunit [Sphingomonas sanguinis]|uniref:HlyD family efflux transporter periplasmic adaptor subunit n=1 Tax=Sphingomonas sanguinis TaxID=33051 RepID=A0ABU5LPU2_9SPHN|nr:HlyD family efflux transporter periplasmic adaptor subunit [Sphingomonas sanguinis]MDZ7281955.1 HlyD family efflux transporter periplasmic adaptor subunit [Sphingomonas sanguinis]